MLRLSTCSTCSNRSFSDETVKNFSRVSCRFGQLNNICLTVGGSLQDSQTGWLSPDIRYERVMREWPISHVNIRVSKSAYLYPVTASCKTSQRHSKTTQITGGIRMAPDQHAAPMIRRSSKLTSQNIQAFEHVVSVYSLTSD